MLTIQEVVDWAKAVEDHLSMDFRQQNSGHSPGKSSLQNPRKSNHRRSKKIGYKHLVTEPIGLVWGAWHIPYYLFFLDRATLADFSTLNMVVYIVLAIWIMVSWSFVYGEIRLLTNSFWPAVLMHAVEDAFIGVVIAEKYIRMLPGTDWLISPMNGLLMSLFFIIIGVWLHQYRKRKKPLALKGNIRTVAGAA